MKLSFIAISAALVISLACCERRSASDTTITTAVKNKLAADPTTSAAKIDVDTSNGVVTLSGKVPTAAEKSEAERVARNTQGGRQGVNNISAGEGESRRDRASDFRRKERPKSAHDQAEVKIEDRR